MVAAALQAVAAALQAVVAAALQAVAPRFTAPARVREPNASHAARAPWQHRARQVMGRPARFDRDELLDAAVALLATGGTAALTVATLAARTGASTGSIYHRFASMELLAGEVWVRAVERFQSGFVAALAGDDDDTLAAGVAAARHTPRWARAHLAEARVLLLYRREELAARLPRPLAARLARLHAAGSAAVRAYARRHFGRASTGTLRRATFALIDVPYGAVRRDLVAGRAPPRAVDELVARASAAILANRPDGRTAGRPQIPPPTEALP